MKKAAVFLMILTISVSSAACGNKEKDDNQADAEDGTKPECRQF